jgi:hypothetical protein
LYPLTWEVLAVQLRTTEWVEDCAAVALPDKGICRVAFDALLTTESVPVAAPAVVGPKFTDTVTEAEGAKVTFDPPLAVKPVPEADTEEIARFELPLLVKVTSCAVEAPTATLPNVTLELLETSWADAPVGADGLALVEVEVPEVEVADLLAVPAHPALPKIARKAMADNRSSVRRFR